MDNKVWLTDEQIEAIVSILTKQCDRIEDRNQKLNVEYPDLYDELYYTGRRHSDTGAVYAGFTEATEIPDQVFGTSKLDIRLCADGRRGRVMLLFSIRQVAVGLDHQVDILFHLRPA